MEKKISFAYKPRDVVDWGYTQARMERLYCPVLFLSDPKYSSYIDEWVDYGINKMRDKGWSDEKILRMCSENLPEMLNHSPRVPLTEIIASNHPIVKSWDELDVRKALYKMALDRIANSRVEAFENIIENNLYQNEYREREIALLEKFASLLVQQATPAMGIRNR